VPRLVGGQQRRGGLQKRLDGGVGAELHEGIVGIAFDR
jgi:hypothetical protein